MIVKWQLRESKGALCGLLLIFSFIFYTTPQIQDNNFLIIKIMKIKILMKAIKIKIEKK